MNLIAVSARLQVIASFWKNKINFDKMAPEMQRQCLQHRIRISIISPIFQLALISRSEKPRCMHGVCNYGGFIWSWSRDYFPTQRHVRLWRGHLQNFGAQGDFGRNVKSMGKWRAFICIDSYNEAIRVISKIRDDSESPINYVYESVGFFEKTRIIKLWESMQIKVHHSPTDLALRAKSPWAQKFWRCPGHSGTCAGHVTTSSRWTTPGCM